MNQNIEVSFFWIGIAVLFVAFWDEPDLVDSVINYLNK